VNSSKKKEESKFIDLNADAGESYGTWQLGADAELFPLLSSVNIACGFHAGDSSTMLHTLELAAKNKLAIGAHPGYPDLLGFGRREMKLEPNQVYADVLYQISALEGMARTQGLALHHVKAHGAMYNQAATDIILARAIAKAVYDFDAALPFVGLPNSNLEKAAQEFALPFIPEAFPERGYVAAGQLASRNLIGSSIIEPEIAAARAVSMAQGIIETLEATTLEVQVKTLCIHGDNPNAVNIAKAVRIALENAGFEVRTYT
jgi:5-oxoprolinase (ATP-hydrolysing) subunit A